MFCKNCGKELMDDALFCDGCGTATGEKAAPVQTAAPAQSADAAASVKKILHFIVAGIATLALILGIMNIFGLFDVNVTAKFMGQKMSASGPVSDVYDESTGIMIGGVLYGLACLGIAGVGVLYFLKGLLNNDLYDKTVGKITKPLLSKFVAGDGVLTLMGAVGAAFSIIKLFFYLVGGPENYGVTTSVSMHWFGWVMLFVYAGMACADIFWLNKKEK